MGTRAGCSTLTQTPAGNRNPNLNPFAKECLGIVRAELGIEVCDSLVPLVGGGVQMHKIFGLMHDTCSTANRVAELMSELREE